jgi:hypothetical protein
MSPVKPSEKLALALKMPLVCFPEGCSSLFDKRYALVPGQAEPLII